ncbi:MAG: septation protein SpoVG family protein [Oscillospiraceae bacterium]|nr:septation protein SpoVG family protein [Oscillospiraceae bacterium]
MNKMYVHNLWRQEDSKVKAYADVTIGNAITLRGIKLVAGENGDFVAMPTRKYEKDGEDKYADIFYPKSEEVRTALLETFQRAYESEDKYAYLNGDLNPEFNATVSTVKNSSTSIRAWATLNIGDEFVIRNIAINETSKGFMVNFPTAKYEKDGETKFNELVAPEKAEWTDSDGKACSKDYGKLIRGLIVNAYKPTLSQQIDNADKAKGDSADMQKDISEQDIQK